MPLPLIGRPEPPCRRRQSIRAAIRYPHQPCKSLTRCNCRDRVNDLNAFDKSAKARPLPGSNGRP
jgi:hypothetical protein